MKVIDERETQTKTNKQIKNKKKQRQKATRGTEAIGAGES